MTRPEDLMKIPTEQMKNLGEAANTTLEGFRKLTELNLQTARAALEASSEQIRALLAAHDVQTLTELASSYAKPQPDAFKAYAQAVYAISSQTGTELAKMVEKQIDESQRQLYATVEELASKAPAGTEGAVSFIKQVLAASSSAYDQVNKATRHFAEMADAAVSKDEPKTSRPTRRKV